jgi:hypothetical protein
MRTVRTNNIGDTFESGNLVNRQYFFNCEALIFNETENGTMVKHAGNTTTTAGRLMFYTASAGVSNCLEFTNNTTGNILIEQWDFMTCGKIETLLGVDETYTFFPNTDGYNSIYDGYYGNACCVYRTSLNLPVVVGDIPPYTPPEPESSYIERAKVHDVLVSDEIHFKNEKDVLVRD